MTISNASRTAGPFIGNGITTDFPFSYKVFSRNDLLVARTVTATSVESILVLDSDYTVIISADQNTNPGGTIRLLAPLAIGSTLAATSNLSIVQNLDLTNGGGFYPEVINRALDRIVINIQQLAAKIGTGAINVGTAATIAAVLNALGNLAAAGGSATIGYVQLGANALLRTLQDKAREFPTFSDWAGIGTGDVTAKLQAALDTGYAFVNARFFNISAPLRISSLSRFEGNKAGIAFIGNTQTVKSAIKKTNNAVVSIVNFETGTSSNQDCIAYIDPNWIDNGAAFPQKVSLTGMAFQGNPTAPNSHGLYIDIASNIAVRDVQFSHVINAIYAKTCFASVFENIQTSGKIVWTGGTSVTFTNVGSGSGAGTNGGFSFASLIYSTMNSCWVDGGLDTAFRFVNSKLTLNGCGCETSTTQTANSGTAIAFDGGDDILVNNFNCVPMVNQVLPIYTVGFDCAVTFNLGCSSFGVAGVNCPDLYVWGSNSTVIFNDYKFFNGTRDNPVIQFANGVTSSKVIVRFGNNEKVYTSNGSGATIVEAKNDSGTFSPALTFGGASVGMAYGTRTGTWQKNGKIVTISGRIALTAKGTSTGIAQLSGWPVGFVPLGDVQVDFSLAASITAGPISGLIDIGSFTANLLLRGATGDANIADGSFSNTTLLRFTATFTIA